MVWSRTKTMIDHRLAMHVRAEPFHMLNTSPMVSFTFDDIPDSAAAVGARMLEAHGATGTFYVASQLLGTKTSNWTMADDRTIVSLHKSGHEIGCHTFSHPRICDLGAAELTEQIAANRRYLETLDPSIETDNFAYPFGYGSYRRSDQLRLAFTSCRGIVPGVNHDLVDLQFLQAMPLISCKIDSDKIDRAFDEAFETNGWLIFYTHDVADAPSPYGCTPALLDHALKAADRRKISILNVAEALRHAGA